MNPAAENPRDHRDLRRPVDLPTAILRGWVGGNQYREPQKEFLLIGTYRVEVIYAASVERCFVPATRIERIAAVLDVIRVRRLTGRLLFIPAIIASMLRGSSSIPIVITSLYLIYYIKGRTLFDAFGNKYGLTTAPMQPLRMPSWLNGDCYRHRL